MSRVRDALRRSETWQERPRVPQPMRLPPNPGPAKPHFEAASPFKESELAAETPETSGAGHSLVLSSQVRRWFNRARRWAGLRTGVPVQLCKGMTRVGLPCRGPAMANGYCRLHGGSRRAPLQQIPVTLSQGALALWGRAFRPTTGFEPTRPARQPADLS